MAKLSAPLKGFDQYHVLDFNIEHIELTSQKTMTERTRNHSVRICVMCGQQFMFLACPQGFVHLRRLP